jgi:hypothetical protein
MPIDAAIESVLKRDRIVVISALSMVVVVSWAYVLAGAGMDMSAFEMTRMISGDAGMVMWRSGHGDDARCLGHWLRKPYVLHVVGHDDRNDAALGSTDGPFVCGYEPQTKGER